MTYKNILINYIFLLLGFAFHFISSSYQVHVSAFHLLISSITLFFLIFIHYLYSNYKVEKNIISFIKRFEELNQRQLIVAFDFDNTLCKSIYPSTGFANSEMVKLVRLLQKHNVYTILWTCRSDQDLEIVKEWCNSYNLNFDKYNEHSEIMKKKFDCASPKVYSDILIDDKVFNAYKINNLKQFYDILRGIR